MPTVADILQTIEYFAPANMKESWDNVGLLCGSRSQAVKKVLIALDPFGQVCQEAAEMGADLIVTHHPLIFRPVSAVTDDTEVGRCIQFLCRNGISCINAHTNLDETPGGVNDELAQRLHLKNVDVLNPRGTDEMGRKWGLLRCGDVEEQPLEDFLCLVKQQLGTPVLRYADGGRAVRKVAVGGGACATEFMDAVRAGCDTFVTADVKYNQFFDCRDYGMTIIDAGHFYTENPVVTVLAQKIAAAFPNIEVNISEKHTDCMKFY